MFKQHVHERNKHSLQSIETLFTFKQKTNV